MRARSATSGGSSTIACARWRAHWSKVGKNLGEAVGAYNSAVASMETRVLVTARRFKDLDAVPDDRTIVDVAQVGDDAARVQAPELQAEAA